ncbi:MAG: hypothetical protein WB869_09880 [Candidatus Acidiferrales bacterium]
MRKVYSVKVVLLLELSCAAKSPLNEVPGVEWKQLPRLGQAGWSDRKLSEIQQYVQAIGSTSAMIVQHGGWWMPGKTSSTNQTFTPAARVY